MLNNFAVLSCALLCIHERTFRSWLLLAGTWSNKHRENNNTCTDFLIIELLKRVWMYQLKYVYRMLVSVPFGKLSPGRRRSRRKITLRWIFGC